VNRKQISVYANLLTHIISTEGGLVKGDKVIFCKKKS